MDTLFIRVLLVEDNPDDAELFSEYLDLADGIKAKLVHVDRIRDATKALAESDYDVMLLDLSLPDSHGIETISRVRAQDPHVPIIILTGLNDQAIAYEAARSGAQDYLVKGKVDPDVLGRTIRYAIERARSEQELRKHRNHLGELVAQRTADLREKSDRLENEMSERSKVVEARALLSTAIENASESFVITGADGVVEYVNPAFEKMSKYSREEVIGQNPRIWSSGHHDDAFYKEFYETIGSGHTWRGQFINKKKDGTLYNCEADISSVRGSGGKVLKYIQIMRDVTEDLKIREMLARTQRLESVGQLAGGIAHDFNNIIQAILGYAELTQSMLPAESTASQNLHEIQKAADRAAELTRQLLAFSRRQVLKREPISVNDVIRGLLNMLKRLLRSDIELDFIPGHSLGTVEADLGQLEQVLVNLCVNARDAMDGAGRITIETEHVLLNGDYVQAHPWARPGRFVLLSVSDSGCGMPPEVLSQAFEPFFTTKEDGRGTGLGLATTYGIVKQHDGFIHCYSEVGNGTSFKIYLPMSAREARFVGAKLEASARGGSERILVVEDDEAIRSLVRQMLERGGYTVFTAPDGAEALKMCESGKRFDLIVSDVVMPKMGGLELNARLEAMPDAPPMLLTSGYTTRAIKPDLGGMSNISLLQKPYSSGDLLRRVRSILDER